MIVHHSSISRSFLASAAAWILTVPIGCDPSQETGSVVWSSDFEPDAEIRVGQDDSVLREENPGPTADARGNPSHHGTASIDPLAPPPSLILWDLANAGGGYYWMFASDLNLAGATWISGGSVINDTSSIRVRANLETTLCTEQFFRGTCVRFTPNCSSCVWNMGDFGLDQNVESVEIRTLGGYPYSTFTYQENFPHHRHNELSPRIQGIAHDDNRWFIANSQEIASVPVTSSLNASTYSGPELHVSDIPGGCDHIGDIDYYKGELYIPLEKCDGPDYDGDDRIAVYDITSSGGFVYDRQAVLGNQSGSPWVALNPINGYMYSSDFGASGNTVVRVYDRTFSDGAFLDNQMYRVFLNRHHAGVQGGAFDERGNLYLMNNTETNSAAGDAGIYVYRISGGYGSLTEYIHPNGFVPGVPKYEEIEGIDWWDLSNETRTFPGIQTGSGAAQVHWLLLDRDTVNGANDEFYLKHVRLH